MTRLGPAPTLTRIRAGDSLVVEVTVTDAADEGRMEMDPSGAVTLSLYDPTGATVLDAAVMANVNGGLHRLTVVTTPSMVTGLYLGEAQATHGGQLFKGARLMLFELAV